ncbi:hypothetical protein [uncultured Gimesia sp.]|uniref:hypothetical protein n=1 Tax=uncultured Gimesia sp. TaxID=1678688 RepID=UPI0030D9C36C|tara:strand:+ start:30565 stop:31452 length:888 start_codon:yes stop_codon:yes gene_type:complete
MAKSFDERNQSDSARRKLKSLAKASGVELELVSALANFTWDYDTEFRNEPIGWVNNSKLSRAAEKQLHWIAETLAIPPDFTLDFDRASKDLRQSHAAQSINHVWANFTLAAVTKNYGYVSEFASYHYLRGINTSRIKSLEWSGKGVGMVEIARNLFLKLFRGGAIERDDLAYLWCDLAVPLDYHVGKPAKSAPWLEPLLASIESLPTNSGLKDLIACCKGLVGGDKFFKKEVLQSLSYADVLRVTGLPVSDMFIAERRNELSPHFYSNEWSFPMRFWSSNGGTVNRSAIPQQKPT